MATATVLITDALEEIGAIEADEPLTNSEIQKGLKVLNRLLGEWSAQSLMVYVTTRESFVTVASTPSYTIGTGSTWNTTRPTAVEQAFIRISNIDYPVRVIQDRAEYERISDKNSVTGQPRVLYYDPTYAAGTVYLYPMPDIVYTVHLISLKPFTVVGAVTESVSLPVEYETAIVTNLAIRLAPSFNLSVKPETVAIAEKSLSTLIRRNAKHPISQFDGLLMRGNRGRYDINSGGYVD